MDEFAPLYSTRERIILAIKAVLICVPLYVIGDYWFVPWLGDYAKDAHCQQYGSLNGVELLMYGIFCGIPLSTALLLWFALGRRAARTLRARPNHSTCTVACECSIRLPTSTS